MVNVHGKEKTWFYSTQPTILFPQKNSKENKSKLESVIKRKGKSISDNIL